jgi:hypothetical protein
MEKYEAKEMPWEEQREMLVDFIALQLPKLHQQLMMAYGEEKGQEIYDKIYEMEFQDRSSQFIGKDVGEVMLAEMEIFPALGWKLWVEKREENGVTCWYEHLEHCPPLAACRKYGLPDPCTVVCDAEIKLAEENKVGK